MSARIVAAWGVHLLTASSAPAGLLAILAIIDGDFRRAFLCMAYAIAVDAIDGTLARLVRVKEVLPFVDGSRLDDLVDYLTYVVVPAFFVVRTGLVPAWASIPVASAMLVASGYGFAQTAAKTVAKMVEKIKALPQDMPPTLETRNAFVRMVHVKEEHAQKCKQELLILWTDYFKPEHLETFPTLHETFWKAAKLCSKNKQEVNAEAAQKLVAAVEEIAEIFSKASAKK